MNILGTLSTYLHTSRSNGPLGLMLPLFCRVSTPKVPCLGKQSDRDGKTMAYFDQSISEIIVQMFTRDWQSMITINSHLTEKLLKNHRWWINFRSAPSLAWVDVSNFRVALTCETLFQLQYSAPRSAKRQKHVWLAYRSDRLLPCCVDLFLLRHKDSLPWPGEIMI